MNPCRYWENFTRPLIRKAPYAPVGIPETAHGISAPEDRETLNRKLSEYQVTVIQRDPDITPTVESLSIILAGVSGLAGLMGGKAGFVYRLQGVEFRIVQTRHGGYGQAHGVSLNRNGFDTWTVVHELGHAWDGVNGWNLSARLRKALHAGYRSWWYILPHLIWPADERFWYYPGDSPPPCGIDQNFNAKEDFAEAVTAGIYPEEAARRAVARGWPYFDPDRGYTYASFSETPRAGFIRNLLATG